MKVIILDVDGVLNCAMTTDRIEDPHDGYKYIGLDTDKIERLNKIVVETGAKIVLSTTWRKFDHFKSYLYRRMAQVNPELPGMVIGQTPIHMYDHGMRAEEIDEWLSTEPKVKQFIVLDDLACDNLDKFGESFIQTYYSNGLTDELTEKCIERLS
jgi:hypothetical protein